MLHMTGRGNLVPVATALQQVVLINMLMPPVVAPPVARPWFFCHPTVFWLQRPQRRRWPHQRCEQALLLDSGPTMRSVHQQLVSEDLTPMHHRDLPKATLAPGSPPLRLELLLCRRR